MQSIASDPFYITGGTLPLDAPSYVTRQADNDLFAALNEGQYCYVLNSRQMGKSSLMTRCAQKLREAGTRVHILDLQKYGSNLTAEQWYRGILEDIVIGLGLPTAARDYWRENREIGPLNRLLNIVRDFVLPTLPSSQLPAAGIGKAATAGALPQTSSLVIFIDEVDYILSLPFSADELFAGVRDCYNRRSEDPRYQHLTFCLLGVATPADLIRDPQTTPFNIGKRIVLGDFTPAEAAPLAEGLYPRITQGVPAIDADEENAASRKGAKAQRKEANSESWDPKLLERILYWTHGHPYLTQKLCQALASDPRTVRPPASLSAGAGARNGGHAEPALSANSLTPARVDDLVAELFLSARAEEQEDNLLFVRNRLLRGSTDVAAVLDTYRRVWTNRPVLEDDADPHVALLKLSGIVRVEDGRLRVRNQIYRSVFNLSWIARSMPDAEVQRQKAARRKGFLHAAAIAVPVIVLLSLLTLVALDQRNHATELDQQLRGEVLKTRLDAATIDTQNGELKRQKSDLEQKGAALQQETLQARKAESKAASNAEKANRATNRANEALVKETIQRERAQTETQEKETILYPHLIERASRALLNGNPKETRDSLDQCGPRWRGPEWYYLQAMVEPRDSRETPVYQKGAGTLPDKRVSLVACSPDGHTIATYCNNQIASLWDNARLHKIADLQIRKIEYNAMAFVDGGRHLLCGSNKGIGVCDAGSGRHVEDWTNVAPSTDSGEDKVQSLALSPDGGTIAYGLNGRDVGLRAVSQPHGVSQWLRFPDERVAQSPKDFNPRCIAFSVDGSMVAAGVGKGNGKSMDRVCVWDVRSKRVAAVCAVPRSEIEQYLYVNSVLFAGDGKHVLAAMGSGMILVWNIDHVGSEPMAPARAIPAHQGSVYSLLSIFDGAFLASCGDDGAIKLWDASALSTGGAPLLIDTFRGHSGPVLALAFARGERALVSTGSDGTMRQWNFDPHRTAVRAREKEMFALYPSKSGERYVVYGDNGYVSVRETQTARELFRFEKPGTVCTRAVLSPDARTVAISYVIADVRSKTKYHVSLALYSVDIGCSLGEFSGNVEGIEALAFSPNGRYLATGARYPAVGNWPYRIRLWDVAARREIGAFTGLLGTKDGHNGWVECLVFSPDGKMLVSGGGENNLRFWDVASRKESVPQIAEAHNGYLRCAAFSTDGKWLATGGADGLARLWKWRNGKIEDRENPLILRGHLTTVKSLAFSLHGETLITTGEQGIVKFWSMATVERAYAMKQENKSGYLQEALSLQVEPYGDYPVAGAFFAPSIGSRKDSGGQIIVGLQAGQILYWGKGDRASQTQTAPGRVAGVRH